ncbi:lysostaphin resistance A-like protein [Oleiharenicola sp. Vm1]|uniref:CPBP family intramembrane glutamic endopeptidase n=1 Tax=Oleiharenicola sp. Vm1 TaxID=3398393 RepID=UPI0039F63A2C
MIASLACALLALAVAALWLPGSWLGRPAWQWLTVVALGAAWGSGVIRAEGACVAYLWFLALQVWTIDGGAPGRRRALEAGVVLVAAAALMAHAMPGFANPRLIDAVRFTPDAVPFSLYVNFDKTLLALGLLGLAHARVASAREWRRVFVEVAKVAPLAIAVVLAGSFALGYVRWAPKLPVEAPLWLAVNLLFTCTAEEALFRGFVQGGLRRAWERRRGGNWAALAVAAVLFGLAHAAGGWKYVALATVAGAGYGWVYERTQRVEASVLAHWALNALHFFLFTYPALAR